MPIPQLVLYHGDPYRCLQALREREAAIAEVDSACERHALFAPEADPGSLEIELRSASLFALGRHFVIRQIDKLRAPAAKKWGALLEDDLSPGTFVTLLAAPLKASHPVLKLCKKRDAAVSLPAPKRQTIVQEARKILASMNVEIQPRGLEELVARSGGQLLAIAQEAQKLHSYAPDSVISKQMIEELTFPAAEQTVFPFYDRVGARDLAGALRTLEEVREDAGRLLGGTIRHLTRLAMVRLLLAQRVPNAQIAEYTGCQEWLVRKLVGQAKQYTLEEVTAALALGVRLDVRIKSGGIASSDALLELLLEATHPAPRVRG